MMRASRLLQPSGYCCVFPICGQLGEAKAVRWQPRQRMRFTFIPWPPPTSRGELNPYHPHGITTVDVDVLIAVCSAAVRSQAFFGELMEHPAGITGKVQEL